MTEPQQLLDISVLVHLTVQPQEWEDCTDAEIAEDVAKHIDSVVRTELRNSVTDFSGTEVALCEREF